MRKEKAMSRSNYDKPFFVDVGTSIVAIRCASNRDVIFEYDHGRCPHVLKIAKDVCERMNKEAEIGKPLRNCDVGTAMEQAERQDKYCMLQDCHKCYTKDAAYECTKCYAKWSQEPYEEGESDEQ
jgi:hypothetical protein